MDYRKICRGIAIFELICKTLFAISAIELGYTLIQDHPLPLKNALLLYWIQFALSLVFCILDFLAIIRLFKATKEGADPNSAIHLVQLWWYLALFEVVIRITNSIALVYNLYVGISDALTWQDIVGMVYAIVRCFEMVCVHKFKTQMHSALSSQNTLEGRLTLTQINNRDYD